MSRWFVERRPPSAHARARIVAFPYAGAGAGAYGAWPPLLPDDIAFQSVRLPGRESRFTEPYATDLEEVADDLAPHVAVDLPLVLFGYSLGSLLAYELARRLGDAVAMLTVGGADAPHRTRRACRLSHLPDAAFADEMRALGGTPDEVFDHPDLLSIVLPVLRADFAMLEAYRHRPGARLRCPVVSYVGTEDVEVTEAGTAAWADTTTNTFSHRSFAGDHFFLMSDPAPLLGALATDIGAVLFGDRP